MFGLPMIYVRSGFTDRVSGRAVNHYKDKQGRRYLAHHRWDLFGRMRLDPEEST